jgi:predicted DNA-binding transcriptional regulator YafY
MARSERLLAIMQFMRAHRGPVTATAVAEYFGVSPRTIYRDIAVLVSQGALIEGAAGLGYTVAPGHFLPPLMFDRDEADAITLGLRYVMRRGDAALGDGARNALAKIMEVMPEQFAQHARFNGLVVGPVDQPHNGLITVVRNAIRSERKVTFCYDDLVGRSSSRITWPVALGFFDGVEMLAAWCEQRGDFRHFRLDRMRDSQVIEQRMPVAHRTLLADYRKIERGIEL